MAVHAAKRHGREGEVGGEGERGETDDADSGGRGGKAAECRGGKETESKRANGMAVEDTETEREQRGRDRETPTQTDRRMIVPPAATGRKARMAPAGAQLWHFQPCVVGRPRPPFLPCSLARANYVFKFPG